MTDAILKAIGESFPLDSIDTGELSRVKAGGMKFRIEAYRAKGLGRISVMRARGFFGLMKMDTVIINPTELDLPLYSYDRIFAMGNDTLIVELYDTLVSEYDESAILSVKNRYSSLAERDPGEHWYDSIKLCSSISKKGKKVDTPKMNALAMEHFDAYISSCRKAPEDLARKSEKASYYVNGLLEKGGPSTNVFKKTIGAEKTERLFKKILFGV